MVALVVKNLPANAGDVKDTGSIPVSGRSAEVDGNPLQYSCLENPTDRGAWRATVRGVTKGQTRLKQHSTLACTHPEVHLLRIIVPVTSMGLVGRVEPPPLLQSSRTSPLAYNSGKVAPPWTEQGRHPLLLLLGLRKVGWLVPQWKE